MKPQLCCVCGEEICEEEASAFDACEDCLDNTHQDPEAFLEQALSEPSQTSPIAVADMRHRTKEDTR